MSAPRSEGPGATRVAPGTVRLNDGRPTQTLVVENVGDRPVQVGSHTHLPDTNPALVMDRDRVVGHHLDIPSGTSVRFEPGVSRSVTAVPFGGPRRVPGIALRPTDHGGSRG